MNFELSEYGKQVVSQYTKAVPFYLPVNLDLTGTASEIKKNKQSAPIPNDLLLLGAMASFDNDNVLVQVEDNGYTWSDDVVPVHAIAGASGNVQPIVPLPIEYLLGSNQRLKLQAQNSAASPTTGGVITWIGLRLIR